MQPKPLAKIVRTSKGWLLFIDGVMVPLIFDSKGQAKRVAFQRGFLVDPVVVMP